MGILDRIRSAFGKLFGSIEKYDDGVIVSAIRAYPEWLKQGYGIRLQTIIDDIHRAFNTANDSVLTIGIVGDFSVGKSSFVNAILGERVVPTSVKPCTAIITKIKYGKQSNVAVRYNDGKDQIMSYNEYIGFSSFNLDDLTEIEREGIARRFENIAYATIYVKSDFLKENNLCLVDTLGLMAHKADNEKTIAAVKDSIATIYLCSPRGLSNSDVQFISQYLDAWNNGFFLCINMIDRICKSERKKIVQLAQLKMRSIVHTKAGGDVDFPPNRIYEVSSLYQEFANGFTDHDDYRKDVDYRGESGFMQVMGDLCEFVKTNANVAKKKAIKKQLHDAYTRIEELKNTRHTEIGTQLAINEGQLHDLNAQLTNLNKHIEYVNALFDNLKRRIYSLLPCLFNQYSQKVDNDLNGSSFREMAGKFSYGKWDVFISSSLKPVVDLAVEYLQKQLQLVFRELEGNVSHIVMDFFSQHRGLFKEDACTDKNRHNKSSYPIYILPYSIMTQKDVTASMYKAAEEVAEFWMREDDRKRKMLEAAVNRSLSVMQNSFENHINRVYNCIKQKVNEYNKSVIQLAVNEVNMTKKKIKEIENTLSFLNAMWKTDSQYFNNVQEAMTAYENTQLES